jgi:hypothetical protein
MRLSEDQPQPLTTQPGDDDVCLVESSGNQQRIVYSLLGWIKGDAGSKGTRVVFLTQCGVSDMPEACLDEQGRLKAD